MVDVLESGKDTEGGSSDIHKKARKEKDERRSSFRDLATHRAIAASVAVRRRRLTLITER